jgi:hypothetical protein
VSNVDIRAHEPVDHLRERQGVLQVLVDDVMDGGGAGRNGLSGADQGIHGVGDAAAAHHVDAGDFDDRVGGGINPCGLYVDDADQPLCFLVGRP